MPAPPEEPSVGRQRQSAPSANLKTPAGSHWLIDVSIALVIVACLWFLHIFGRTLSGAVLVTIWIALTSVLSLGLFVRARVRRRAFLYAYLSQSSTLARRWQGGVLMAVRVAALSAALAAVLMIALLRMQESAVWMTLIAAALLLAPLQHYVQCLLATQVNAAWLAELSRRVSIALLGVVMMVALLLLALHRPQPELAGVSLDTAVWHFVERENARSGMAALLLELAAAKDGLKLWLGQQLLPEPGISFLQAAAWAVILAEELLFVWSYLLVISATLVARDTLLTRLRDSGSDSKAKAAPERTGPERTVDP